MLITVGLLTTLALMHLALGRRAAVASRSGIQPALTSSRRAAAGNSLASARASAITGGRDPASLPESAKSLFISLQAANDRADLDTLRAGLSSELFEVVCQDIKKRRTARGRTRFRNLNAQLLDMRSEGTSCNASLWFTGRLHDPSTDQTTELDEVWKITAPRGSPAGWRVTAIQLH